jgi:hypothetical protein
MANYQSNALLALSKHADQTLHRSHWIKLIAQPKLRVYYILNQFN